MGSNIILSRRSTPNMTYLDDQNTATFIILGSMNMSKGTNVVASLIINKECKKLEYKLLIQTFEFT